MEKRKQKRGLDMKKETKRKKPRPTTIIKTAKPYDFGNPTTKKERNKVMEEREEHSVVWVKDWRNRVKQKLDNENQIEPEPEPDIFECGVEGCYAAFPTREQLLQHNTDKHLKPWMKRSYINRCKYNKLHKQNFKKVKLGNTRISEMFLVIRVKDYSKQRKFGEQYKHTTTVIKWETGIETKNGVEYHICLHCGKEFVSLDEWVKHTMVVEYPQYKLVKRSRTAIKAPNPRHTFKQEKTTVSPHVRERERANKGKFNVDDTEDLRQEADHN